MPSALHGSDFFIFNLKNLRVFRDEFQAKKWFLASAFLTLQSKKKIYLYSANTWN